MNGVAVIVALLHEDAAILTLVPADRIMSGDLPVGIDLPAISVTQISSVDRNIPRPGATRFVTDRVQVTILAADYPAKAMIQAAAKKALADQMPSIAGLSGVVVHSQNAGPDFRNAEAGLHIGTQDYRVRYNQER